MNITAQIDKLRQIPQTDVGSFTNKGPLFIPRQDVSNLTRKVKPPKPPRNANLYDPIENMNSSDDRNSDEYDQNFGLDDNQIASSIITANGGISYSNEKFEKHWKTKSKQSLNLNENDFKKIVSETLRYSRTSASNSNTDQEEHPNESFEKHYKTKQEKSSNIDLKKNIIYETASCSKTFISTNDDDGKEQLKETFKKHYETEQEKSSNIDENNLKKDIVNRTASCNKISTSKSGTDEKEHVEDMETVLEKCRLTKNAVIRGLLKSHTISVTDLIVPSHNKKIEDKTNNVQF